jgi:RNA polymerase-binding transcription factor DksA
MSILFKKSAHRFSAKRSSILDVFTKTKQQLLTLISEQNAYVADKIDERNKINYEIEVTENSVTESEKLLRKIDEFLN